MLSACFQRIASIFALALLVAMVTSGRVSAIDDPVGAGTIISNRAEATYRDATGTGFSTVSPTVSVTVLTVSALAVTPDETDPSATVSPGERVTRLFRLCNTGNTPDLYTITRAEASAPAHLTAIFFDMDGSLTLTDNDRAVVVGTSLSPRLARGACIGVLAQVETGASPVGSRLSINITARSNVTGAVNSGSTDTGQIINTVGEGAHFNAPDDARLPPVKLVEGVASTTAAFGQTLSYTISFRNHGDVVARNTVLRDELPEGLEYVAGSLHLNGQALTDADDGDMGRITGRRIEVRKEEVAVGELVQVAFQARADARVPPGTGLVNAALVSADNAPAITSSNAIAVVNPFGLVYEGRSQGTPVAGARVRLLTDLASDASATLQPGLGSVPNEHNDNPFTTDGQGRWSFVLTNEQTSTPTSPRRYFLNVTAPAFRTRMLEATITPTATPSLFTLALRALDGQPIAQSGSFELTEENVQIPNLGAFAFNVPMFENSTLEVVKAADRPTVEIGDVVTYRVEVHNATAGTINDLVLRDTLPASFHYAPATARLENPPDAPRNVEPEVSGSLLVFRLAELPGRARVALIYRVRVGVNAGEGEQVNSAVASGVFKLSGENVSTSPARASVRVRRGLFSTQQIIIGRVFEDANGNALFDDGDKGVAGVRLYLDNGQSVITDSAGQYSFPVVNDGAQVIALDPVTLPDGYGLAPTDRLEERSLTRLLRTPLGGGAMLRQNFALRSNGQQGANANAANSTLRTNLVPQDDKLPPVAEQARLNVARESGERKSKGETNVNTSGTAKSLTVESGAAAGATTPLASGTYEVAATPGVEPVAAGAIRLVSPQPDEVVAGAALEVEARVAEGWSVALEVEGSRINDSKIGERRIDRQNKVATFIFVGINLRPGPNRIKATAIAPDGRSGQVAELLAYGRGPVKRLEIVTEKNELSAGGRDSTRVRLRAFDQWEHPAADMSVALEVSAGRLVAAPDSNKAEAKEREPVAPKDAGTEQTKGVIPGQPDENASQRAVPLVGGEGSILLVADNSVGVAEIRATSGAIEARREIRITPELRSSILVGLAEVSIGSAAPEMALRGDDSNVRSHLAFFYRGALFRKNLLTLSYDSQRPLNRTTGDRLFQLDPLERAYPIFGDSSTRFEDAQSNSKLYARLDRGRSYALFGDFETENKDVHLAGYARRLTGVKVHVENSGGDFLSVTGARPDTAFARDVFPGGSLSLLQLSHVDILPGSEVLVLETRDRRNPEIILTREQLVRSVDYNIDAASGQIFMLRFISAFDSVLNLMQMVVTYEHRANDMSSAVYTGRAVKNFGGMGLRLGMSFVNQRQGEFGSFLLGGIDGEKKLPRGGMLKFEWATSRGQSFAGGNTLQTNGDDAATDHNGNAVRLELAQPLGFLEGKLRAEYARADEGFINPFGASVTPGSQRASAQVDLKVRPSSIVRFGLMDERNRTANVNNERLTASFNWSETFTDRLRASLGYDLRRLKDEASGRETDSNLVTVGAEWQATDKLQLAVKREQNLGEADPTYPNQTTIAANYQWNSFTRIFLTQRLASAPIVPISDAGVTGFAQTGSRRETAIGVETRLGRHTSLMSRYQLENGINGTDSFAIIGLTNRLPINKELSLDLSYERGFHVAGEGESYNSVGLGFAWSPTENFRTSGRYELRDRNGLGTILTLGAAGRLADNLTTLARLQIARTNFEARESSSLSMTAALAWRPLKSDRMGWLFSYTRRDISQDGLPGLEGSLYSLRDRSDMLSTDAYYQASADLELYGRIAIKYGLNGTPDLASVSTFTYLTQGRVVYRLGRQFDVAGEMRMLAQPVSLTRRTSFGAELGFWLLPDLRLGGGYNFTGASEPSGSLVNSGRRGFYFTISSKLSNLFDLFGTANNGEAAQPSSGGNQKETTSERR